MSSKDANILDYAGNMEQEKEENDDDDLISQAYDDFLMENSNNTTEQPYSSYASLSTYKMDEECLITLEDLLGISIPSTSKGLLNAEEDMVAADIGTGMQIDDNSCDSSVVATAILMNIFDQAIKTAKERNDNDMSDSSVIAIVTLMEIFDQACKTAQGLKRWKKSNPGSWKINLAKKRRAEGLPYVTKNKVRCAKAPKPVDCSKCRFNCSNKIDEDTRRMLCRKYWSLDYIGQKNFLITIMEIKNPKSIRLERKRLTNRSFSTQCFFKLEEVRVDVCQKFFCATLCIGQAVIHSAIKKRDLTGQFGLECDPRGKREPSNKTTPENVEEVRNHIRSFPAMESHYIRKNSKRQYLDSKLSIGKMYRLYVDQCAEKNRKPVSEITYRRIFGTDFNLGFFTPKKDQCLLCTKYDRGNVKERAELEKEYREHLSRKQICNDEKKKDKDRANKDKHFISVSFDLQAILQIPSGDIGILYYVRKLTVYNLAIYEGALPNRAYCLAWSEINGKKGSCEIGTILYYYLSQCVPKDVTEVSLFSDTCGGQNRNKNVAALLLFAVQNIENLKMIEQKFLESGHSYMEADSMHSSIEREQKNTAIYSMPDWLNVFKRARSKQTYKKDKKVVSKEKYQVKEFKYNEFKDLKDLSDKILINTTKDTDGNQVKWLKIKRLRYIKGEATIFYNYDMSDKFSAIDVTRKFGKQDTRALSTNTETEQQIEHSYGTRNKTKRTFKASSLAQDDHEKPKETKFFHGELKQLYKTPLKMSSAKKKDLLQLCTKGVIPEEFHAWFQDLQSDVASKDRLPDCNISDEDLATSEEEA